VKEIGVPVAEGMGEAVKVKVEVKVMVGEEENEAVGG
jgi:hypothetical protein